MSEIELNNHTLVLLSQIAAGEWDGPIHLTQWFNNERGPSSDFLPACSNIGIVERRQKIIELAAMIYAEIEEWADRDLERYEHLSFHNPGWGVWDMDLVPRLLCEAFAAAGINEDNLHTLDGEDAWVRIGEYIHRVAKGWKDSWEFPPLDPDHD